MQVKSHGFKLTGLDIAILIIVGGVLASVNHDAFTTIKEVGLLSILLAFKGWAIII